MLSKGHYPAYCWTLIADFEAKFRGNAQNIRESGTYILPRLYFEFNALKTYV